MPYWNTPKIDSKRAIFVHFSFCWIKNKDKYFKKFWGSEFYTLYVENHGYLDYSCTFSDWLDQSFGIFWKKVWVLFFFRHPCTCTVLVGQNFSLLLLLVSLLLIMKFKTIALWIKDAVCQIHHNFCVKYHNIITSTIKTA